MSDDREFVATNIEWSTIYGVRQQRGLVQLTITRGEDVLFEMKLPIDKARDVWRNLTQAIEAAISDELLVKFLTEQVGLELEQAAGALSEFRKMRQGSMDGATH